MDAIGTMSLISFICCYGNWSARMQTGYGATGVPLQVLRHEIFFILLSIYPAAGDRHYCILVYYRDTSSLVSNLVDKI